MTLHAEHVNILYHNNPKHNPSPNPNHEKTTP